MPSATNQQRRLDIIDRISRAPMAAEELLLALKGTASKRTLHLDLAWLKGTFPGQCLRERADGRHGVFRVVYRWIGPRPYLLDEPLEWLSEDEVIALAVARGMPMPEGTIEGLIERKHSFPPLTHPAARPLFCRHERIRADCPSDR